MSWSSAIYAFIALGTLSLTATFGNCQISLTLTLPSTSILMNGGDYTSGIITCFATGATSLQLFRFDVQGSRSVVISQPISIPAGLVLILSDSNVGVDTAGLYQCEATDNSGNTEQRNATIYVDVLPYAGGVFANSNPSNGIVTEGASFTINCSADASISPTPVIDLLLVESVSNTTGYELIYVVSSASKADEGRYECFVENRQGNATKSLPNSISVLKPANVDRFTSVINAPNNRQVEVEEGTDERLECTASGDQPLAVKLLHNSKSLNESVGLTVRAVLTSVKIGQDDGTYTCTAVNGVKTDEQNLTITVYKKASIISFNNASQCIASGAVVTLECVTEGHPTPDVSIFNSRDVELHSAKGKASYNVTAVGGPYTCDAKNKYNTQNRTFTLRVAREPDAPTDVQVGDGASGANELKFTWTAPVHDECDADFPVIRYGFLCSGGGSTTIDVISVSTDQSVAESLFQPSIHYNCSVSAKNSIGNSSRSIPFLLREPSGSPGQPMAQTMQRSALVSWTVIPAEDQHGVIRNYIIDVSCVSDHCISQNSFTLLSTSLQRNIAGLSPNTNYTVQVSGHNVIGEGPKSSPLTFKTKPNKPTGYPQSLDIPQGSVYSTNFTATWQEIPDDQQNDDITSYKVYVECVTPSSSCRAQTISVDAPPRLSVEITNLSPFTTYRVTVSGSNAGGEGPRSPPSSTTTAEGVPGPVQNLIATPFNTTAVTVSWTEPSVLNGQFQRYDVSYSLSGKTSNTMNTMMTSVVIGNLVDEKYAFEVRVVTGGGNSQQRTAEQRPVFPPTVSGPEKTVPLEFNSKRAISCDFRSYPFRGVAKLMRSNEDLTSSADISDRTGAPPHSQRLTYTVSEVGSYSCAFAGPADPATFEVTAPAEIINSTQGPVNLSGSSISIFVEARQYPDIPEISCADLTGEVSTLEYPDGANYRRATFTLPTAQTVECRIVGTDKTVSIIIEEGGSSVPERDEPETGPIFGLPDWYDYLVIGIIVILLVLLLFILLLFLIRWWRRGRMPSCCNFNSIINIRKVSTDTPMRDLSKAPVYEEILSTGGGSKNLFDERRMTESRAYESFKEVAEQRPDEGLNLHSNRLYDRMSPPASVTLF